MFCGNLKLKKTKFGNLRCPLIAFGNLEFLIWGFFQITLWKHPKSVLALVLVLWLVLAFVLAFVLALVLALELVVVASASIWHLAASGLAASGSIWDHL